MNVSVVIVNHNAGRALSDCLASVVPQSNDVVVVDNASDSAAFDEVVAEYSGVPGCAFIRLPQNMGFSIGCNTGARAATGELLLFLNPDSITSPKLIENLKNALRCHPEAAIVGGRLLGEDGSPQRGWLRREPTPWRAFARVSGLARFSRRWDFHREGEDVADGILKTDAVSGACLMIRREVFERVGGFDEGYFLHCEDLDLCAVVKNAGFDVLSCPSAVVFHAKGVCGKARPVFVEWHKHRGMLRYYGKHCRSWSLRALSPVVCFAVWCRFLAVCIRKWITKW